MDYNTGEGMNLNTYSKKCENPSAEVDGFIAHLETTFRRSSKYSYNFEYARFINISFTKQYLRIFRRLCANISFVVEQRQVRAWATIINSEFNIEFGPFYQSAYSNFEKEIEGCFSKHGFNKA